MIIPLIFSAWRYLTSRWRDDAPSIQRFLDLTQAGDVRVLPPANEHFWTCLPLRFEIPAVYDLNGCTIHGKHDGPVFYVKNDPGLIIKGWRAIVLNPRNLNAFEILIDLDPVE